ncbi:MAG: OmpL47-type beta-barrel domain-containing protein, partial [Thermoplasmatota archaeon]
AATFDTGLFTPAIDLTATEEAYVEFDRNFQDFAGAGYAEVNVYSGGTGPGNFEEQLLFLTDDDPSGGVHTILPFDPSGYADPAEVYIEFYYNDEGYNGAWKFSIDNVMVYTPGLYVPGDYTVNATVANYGTTTETFDVNCQITYFAPPVTETVLLDDMESGPNGWTTLATSGSDLWHLSTQRSNSPDTAWYCGDESTGQYENSMINFLISPALNLYGAHSATVSFATWYDLEPPSYDKGYVCASSDNNTFYILKTYTGNSGGWITDSVDITDYINETTGLVNIGFIMYTDSSVCTYEGWYIDDVNVTAAQPSETYLVYDETATVSNLGQYEEVYVEFSPPWHALLGDHVIEVATQLPGDIDTSNDAASNEVTIIKARHNLPATGTPPYKYTIDALDEASSIVQMTVKGETNVYIGEMYPPDIPDPYTPVGPCVDIDVTPESNVVWPIYLEIYYTQDDLDYWGVTEDHLAGIMYYDDAADAWVFYDETGVNTDDVTKGGTDYAGYLWANIYEGELSPKVPVGGDTLAPTSDITVTLDPTGYVKAASTFTIDATDDGLLWKVFYRVDNGQVVEGDWNTPAIFQLNELYGYANGEHTLEYWAEDICGNEERHHVETYVVDQEPPSLSMSFDGVSEPAGPSTWQIASQTQINLSAQDSGVGGTAIYYRVDGSNYTKYTGPFGIPSDGTHTVSYYAVDLFGNERLKTATIKVGSGAPMTTCHLSPDEPTGDNGWYTSPVTVTLTATDDFSGVAETIYRVGSGAWQTYTEPFTLEQDGEQTISFYSVDNAGHVETICSQTVPIDLYGPEITVEKPTNYIYLFDRPIMPWMGQKSIIIGAITIEATVHDPATSGVGSVELYVNQQLKATFQETFSYKLDELLFGPAEIQIVAYDIAGNPATKTIHALVFNW